MINKKALLALINLELLESRPNLSLTKTSRLSDQEDERFGKILESLGRAIVLRNQKVSLDEEKKIYKLFYTHIEKNYFLGQEYSDDSTGRTKSVTSKDTEKIEKMTKEFTGKWLSSLYKVIQ